MHALRTYTTYQDDGGDDIEGVVGLVLVHKLIKPIDRGRHLDTESQ